MLRKFRGARKKNAKSFFEKTMQEMENLREENARLSQDLKEKETHIHMLLNERLKFTK